MTLARELVPAAADRRMNSGGNRWLADATRDPDGKREPGDREPLRLLTVEQACRRLQISRAVCYGLLNSGELRSFHIGRSRRIPVESLDELVVRALGDDDVQTRA